MAQRGTTRGAARGVNSSTDGDGNVEMQYIHTADWWSTFAALAGADPTDHKVSQRLLAQYLTQLYPC
jgi:hypothetical protein